METDPRSPRLKLRPLHGRRQRKHAVRLAYEHRIVLVLNISAREVVLLDVGSHDEVYRNGTAPTRSSGQMGIGFQAIFFDRDGTLSQVSPRKRAERDAAIGRIVGRPNLRISKDHHS